MKTLHTPLAGKIFASIQAQNPYGVFLAHKEAGPKLSFGVNTTRDVSYEIHLETPTGDLVLSSAHPQMFALLMDKSSRQKAPRLVLYCEGSSMPIIEYDGNATDHNMLRGYVLIQARQEGGTETAVLHAVFDPVNGSSLLIDGAEEVLRHLKICSGLILEGGELYDVTENEWDSELDGSKEFSWTTAMD